MANSLLEQVPGVVARGQAEKILEGQEERHRAARKKHVDVGDIEDAATEQEAVKDGHLVDYVSGKLVENGPEERETIQVLSRMLVEDYDHPKACIRARSQHRVKVRSRTHEAKSHCVVESLRCGVIR